jgi:hypothetical protein
MKNIMSTVADDKFHIGRFIVYLLLLPLIIGITSGAMASASVNIALITIYIIFGNAGAVYLYYYFNKSAANS